MKKQGLYLMAVLGILTACNREVVPGKENVTESNAATITVEAGKAGTRTSIIEQTNGFDFTWKAGDKIGIIEGCPALTEDACYTYASEPLAADADAAVFTVHLDDRENLSGRLSYTAYYPYENGRGPSWGYYNEYGQLFMSMEMPDIQYPTADSFDPQADLMISKPVYYNRRLRESDQLTFQFARVGTIVKMVLNGLPEGYVIRSGRVDFGFDAGYYTEIYPEAMLLRGNDGTENIYFDYDGYDNHGPGLVVGPERRVTVWLRCKSGEASVLDVGVNPTGYVPYDTWAYHRRVSFRARGQKLSFKEGGLTSFTINFAPADVENPEEETVQYLTNAARDGVTVSWPASDDEDLAGYEAFLRDEENNRYDFDQVSFSSDRNQWEAVVNQGLPAGEYAFFLRAQAVEHKVSQPEYLEMDLSIGILQNQSITGGSFPGWYTTDQNCEITYRDVLFGYRNMCYGSGWNGSPASLPWALWNKTPLHMEILRVTPSNGFTSTGFQVYASDSPFVDGLPADTDEPLTFNFINGYKEFSLGGKQYFLMTGQNGFYLNGIYMEYYH